MGIKLLINSCPIGLSGRKKESMKDLFKAIQAEVVFINRLGDKLTDRNNMLDHRSDALMMIKEYDNEHGLSKCMKKFLIHRVSQAVMNTANR